MTKPKLRFDHESPEPTQLLEEWPIDDDWLADISFVIREGIAVVGQLTIYPVKDIPAGGLPVSLLRRVKFADIFSTYNKAFNRFVRTIPNYGYAVTSVEVEPERPQRGRPTDMSRHVLMAARWVELVEDARREGRRPSPNIELAEERHMSRATIIDLVHRWRHELELLTHAGAGRADAALTPKAQVLLKEARKKEAKKKSKGRSTTKGRRRK